VEPISEYNPLALASNARLVLRCPTLKTLQLTFAEQYNSTANIYNNGPRRIAGISNTS